MEINIDYKGFKNKKLVFKTRVFTAGHIFLQEQPIPIKSQNPLTQQLLFTVQNDDGQDVEIKLKTYYRFFDRIPELEIDGTKIKLISPLRWHEYVWTALPIILFLIGGFLGGLLGIIATHTNIKVFRSGLSITSKYIFSSFVLFLAYILFIIAFSILQSLLKLT